ncbi:MAG: AMP-binding protein [Thermoproteus sp.]
MEELLRELYSDERVVPPLFKYKAVSPSQYERIYRESLRPEFWAREAAGLVWERPWSKILEGEPPSVRWFVGGLLSPYKNVIGRHAGTWVWEKIALIWRGEEGLVKAYTYSDLDRLAVKYSGVLKALGVGRGDWVMFYAPPTPEVLALMLASARIGAPFEPVFTGFGHGDLAARIEDRRPKVLVTVDAFPRRGRPVRVKDAVDKALRLTRHIPKVLVVRRMGVDVELLGGRDILLDDVPSTDADEAVVEPSHPLFGLHVGYDGGLGRVVHGAGGYLAQTYATTRWIGLRPRDTYFCTVLPGWITGITYVVFGPLMVGSTVVVYEGGPDYPQWDIWWSVLEEYAVTVFLTTAGALRLLSRQDPKLLEAHNLDTLKLILTTAEPMEVKYWKWAYQYVGTGTAPSIDSLPERLSGRAPVIHMFIQTELGTFVTGSLPNYVFVPIAPGSVGPPMPGFYIDVVDDSGASVRGRPGQLVVKAPWPAMPVEYSEWYAERWRGGVYYVGDYAVMADDMNIFPLGRSDAVMKVNGYRISPAVLEKAALSLPGVEDAVAFAVRDPQKFEAPVLIIKGSAQPEDVRRAVREYAGPIADPAKVVAVEEIPAVDKGALRRALKAYMRSGAVDERIGGWLEKIAERLREA